MNVSKIIVTSISRHLFNENRKTKSYIGEDEINRFIKKYSISTNIRKIKLINSNIDSLPCWPNVVDVFIKMCNNIISLPNWPKVLNLSIYGCNNIIRLPYFPCINNLELENTNINILEDWHRLKYIKLNNTQIKSLPCWPNLVKANIKNSPNIIEIPLWPKLIIYKYKIIKHE